MYILFGDQYPIHDQRTFFEVILSNNIRCRAYAIVSVSTAKNRLILSSALHNKNRSQYGDYKYTISDSLDFIDLSIYFTRARLRGG